MDRDPSLFVSQLHIFWRLFWRLLVFIAQDKIKERRAVLWKKCTADLKAAKKKKSVHCD